MASKTDPPQPATLDSVMALVQEQLKAAAAREAQLTKMLEKDMDGSEASPARLAQPSPSPSPSLGVGPTATIKPVSVKMPMLISSANKADFVAWEEAWRDYALCQRLDSHDKANRFAAIRQTLDEDLRRFVREGIITMPLDPDADDKNPRLVRLLLKIRPFQFTASWRKGTANAVADVLSRNPVAPPVDEDQFGEDPSLSCRSLRICLSQTDNPRVDLRFAELRSAAQLDLDYQTLADFIQNGFPRSSRRLPPALAPFWNGREHLIVDHGIILKGSRIVIPASLRSSVVEDLYAAHQGIVHMKARARQIVYWPGMTKQLEEFVRQCQECCTHQRPLSQEPLLNDRTPSLPFELTIADLFSCQGWDFLTYVDRLTGWSCVVRTGRSTSSHDVIIHLRRWFSDVGVPNVLYTDGGPQFTEFCSRWKITQVVATFPTK